MLWHIRTTQDQIYRHIYNDHIELWNEGELPSGYDEKMLYGKHSSKPRNRNIANTMFKAGFIDTWGRGFIKIREGFEGAGMPMPKVENFCGGVQVTIERTKFVQMTNVGGATKDVTSDVTSLSPVQLTDRQKEISKMMLNNPRISVKEMSLVLSLAERTIKRDVAAMQKMGLLVREGNTSAGHWVVIKEKE